MVNVLGLDIGGANTKAAFMVVCDGQVVGFKSELGYFPFWKHNAEQFTSLLAKLKGELCRSEDLDGVGVTMTAELSDAYRTKREGVNQILDCVAEVFDETRVMVLDVDAKLRSIGAAMSEPLKVASANWAATGWMVAQQICDCIVVDVGSTSTSIIPIMNGAVAAFGKTDLDKLANGELVYTGSLRTNVAATIQVVPLRGRNVRVASELFAQSGDVHLALGHITEEDYTADTADGKEKTRPASLARLARVVCADMEMLSEQEIIQIAKYVYDRQVVQIAYGLNQVYDRFDQKTRKELPTVVTGLGKDFLARKAAEKAGVTKIVDLASLLPKGVALASPAVGLALMMATKLEGKRIVWMP
jgi:probable H4MPT-linked C1 transfer pathway protein